MNTPKPVRTIELMLDGQHLDLRMLWTFLVSEYKTLCIPASVDSIPTNCDREDHVSMGPIAGLKALQVIEHVRQILAIELLVGAQALDLRHDVTVSERLAKLHHRIRQKVPLLTQDRELSSIATVREMIDNNALFA
jgi:histidine ammonia-lyase